MAHAKLSPSSAVRWMTCPGSIALCVDIPETSSAAADEGTSAHELAERCLTSGRKAASFIGEKLPLGHVVDSDMAGFVQSYIDFCLDLAIGGEYKVEQKLPISSITGEQDAKGTADFVALVGTELVVADLKYGRGVEVSAEDNPQLQIYALAALRMFGMVEDFKTVRMAICQPRLGAVSEWVQTVEQLEAFAEKVKVSAALTATDSAPLVPSAKACKFCRGKAECPALRDEVMNQFDVIPEEATPDELSVAMSKVDLIEGWCKAIRARVESKLIAGEAVQGYKLVQGRRGARQWTSKDEAEAVLKAMRVKHDQMYDYSVISPTAAEKLAKAEVIGPRQWPRLQALITQPEGKPSVAPESDKRAALVIDTTADFADLTQDLT